MRHAARLIVAVLALAAFLTPVAAREVPRGLVPARGANPPATASWGPMSSVEADPAPAAPLPDASTPCNRRPLRVWTYGEVRCAIRRKFPRDANTALCIARAESRLNARAVGAAGERGIFQIHPVHRAWLGPRRWRLMFDAAANARAARELVGRAGGWGPWTTHGRCGA